ncbi:hypothetical protein D3C85_1945710 [compost metagenome]
MLVSAQPVAPSLGSTEAIGFFSLLSEFTMKPQEPEAAMPSLLKSFICTVASCQ